MPQPDLQKFVIISAAVSGIGLFWWQTTRKCFETVISIVNNQLFVEEEYKKIREQIKNIYSLMKQVLEDEKKMMKAVQDEEAVQELKNKIIEQIENICSKVEKLEEDVQEHENKIEWEINQIKHFCSEFKKIIENLEDMQESGRDEQELLIRVGEVKHLEEEKIRSIVKDLLNN